jgi:hypothetical protein
MKRFTILSLFLCFGITSNSQDYIPFPLENTSWFNGFYQCDEFFMNCFFYGPTEYTTDGDTIINGNQMVKIRTNNTQDWAPNDSLPPTDYIGSLRSDTSKVYFVPWFQQEEVLLYDFSIEIGDTVQVFDRDIENQFAFYEVTPQETYFETFNGISRKVISFNFGRWIEGIGSEYGIFTTTSLNVSGYYKLQECVRVDGEIVFDHDQGEYDCSVLSVEDRDKEVTIYPNPSNGVFKIEGLTGNASVELLDYSGRLIGEIRNVSQNGEVNFKDQHISKGIYLLRISQEMSSQIVRMSVE